MNYFLTQSKTISSLSDSQVVISQHVNDKDLKTSDTDSKLQSVQFTGGAENLNQTAFEHDQVPQSQAAEEGKPRRQNESNLVHIVSCGTILLQYSYLAFSTFNFQSLISGKFSFNLEYLVIIYLILFLLSTFIKERNIRIYFVFFIAIMTTPSIYNIYLISRTTNHLYNDLLEWLTSGMIFQNYLDYENALFNSQNLAVIYFLTFLLSRSACIKRRARISLVLLILAVTVPSIYNLFLLLTH